nr:NUDIX domain-containing protein [Eubacteriales bacterium]
MDLSVKEGNERLNIRTGALIIHDGKLLIAHSARPYWHTVGGRIHLGEDSRTAVEREAFEE